MPRIIISKSTLTKTKEKLLHSKNNPSGFTEEQLNEKVREAIEEEMYQKEMALDTVDKKIVYLLKTCSVGSSSINDLLAIDIGE